LIWSLELNDWQYWNESFTEYDENNNNIYEESKSYTPDGQIMFSYVTHLTYYDELSLSNEYPLKSFTQDYFSIEEGWINNHHFGKYYYFQDNGDVIQLLDNALQIYPNPTSNQFSLNIENNFIQGLTLEIFDLSGKLIHTQITPSGINPKIQLPSIASGTYILKLIEGEQLKSSLLQIK